MCTALIKTKYDKQTRGHGGTQRVKPVDNRMVSNTFCRIMELGRGGLDQGCS